MYRPPVKRYMGGREIDPAYEAQMLAYALSLPCDDGDPAVEAELSAPIGALPREYDPTDVRRDAAERRERAFDDARGGHYDLEGCW